MASSDALPDLPDCQEWPDLQKWKDSLVEAFENFRSDCKVAKTMGADEGFAALHNATTRFYLAFGEANEALGVSPTRKKIRARLLKYWPTREVEGIELRVLATRIAYIEGFRLSASGAKDTPIQAAMLFAAKLEVLQSPDPAETVRKSIQRFRKKARGTKLYQLDRKTLMIECIDAEEAILAGLPGKTGRPKSNRQ